VSLPIGCSWGKRRLLRWHNYLLLRQARRVALFLAATHSGADYPFDLFELRALDVCISDDMLLCIDALRWGKADLGSLLPDGLSRVGAVIQQWGLQSLSK